MQNIISIKSVLLQKIPLNVNKEELNYIINLKKNTNINEITKFVENITIEDIYKIFFMKNLKFNEEVTKIFFNKFNNIILEQKEPLLHYFFNYANIYIDDLYQWEFNTCMDNIINVIGYYDFLFFIEEYGNKYLLKSRLLNNWKRTVQEKLDKFFND
jgi:hypothetical protein